MNHSRETRYLVIHGHFYQPPRENPWTERIERQRSSAPYHDWNERITSECYLPNTRSRRLDGYGRITRLVNNYEWISFNFGPTLLSWLEEHHPEVYEKIIEADRASAARLGGHGNAIAQAYNHIIMPLADRRDQETQIAWGLYDFEHRFGREPEGIWLPEAAINEVTLSMLIDFGFKFIVLSPHQAESVRPLGRAGKWTDVSDGSIPTGFPYRCYKPADRRRESYIDVFFYDSALSQDVSFNHLLRSGDNLADAVVGAYPRSKGDLVVIASDGENYGHHEPFADMALAYLVDEAAPKRSLTLVNFAAYLARTGPSYEVRLKAGRDGEGTSWSCVHGAGRWKEDCGCNTGTPPGWNQAWRTPLRTGLDKLRDALADLYESECGELLRDARSARDEYIEVIENRSPEISASFIAARSKRELDPDERARALTLLESQRNALLMFTSCGWFFNDISGIETVQLLMYAARAIDLADARPLEKRLLADLTKATSNIEGVGTGADLYRDATHGTYVSIPALVAQHAIFSFLFGPSHGAEIFAHFFEPEEETVETLADGTVKLGAIRVTCPYTLKVDRYVYALFIEEESGYRCFLGKRPSDGVFGKLKSLLAEARPLGSKKEVLAEASSRFPRHSYRLVDLFPEDRERVLRALSAKKLEALDAGYRKLYQETRGLVRMLTESSMNVTPVLLLPAQAALTRMLLEEVDRWEHSLDTEGLAGIRNVLAEAAYYGVPIDKSAATESFTDLVIEHIEELSKTLDPDIGEALLAFVSLVDEIEVSLRDGAVQNVLYPILETRIFCLIESADRLESLDAQQRSAVLSLFRLAQRFNFNVDRLLETVTRGQTVPTGSDG
jgi:alpha-amylase/alpha-mannosidase (GH57 family)